MKMATASPMALRAAEDRITELQQQIDNARSRVEEMREAVVTRQTELEAAVQAKRRRLTELRDWANTQDQKIDDDAAVAKQDLQRAKSRLAAEFETSLFQDVAEWRQQLNQHLRKLASEELERRKVALNEQFEVRLRTIGEEVEKNTASQLSQRIADIKRQIEIVKSDSS
jgi:chromosome segregation ATPase